MDQFPQALYRQPGRDVETDSGWCAYAIAADAEALEAALADGWHATPPEAAAANKPADPAAPVVPDDNAPPTRAELERKATELHIKFDGRWSDKRLAEVIAAALKA